MNLRCNSVKNLLPISLIIISVISLSSCGGSSSGSKEVEGAKVGETKYVYVADAQKVLPDWSTENVLINHVVGDADHLHPYNSQNATKSWIHNYLHNYLLRGDLINLTVIPDLAMSLPDTSADLLTYTYTLRTDATYDDGSPITAEDVIFSYKACKSPLTNNPFYKTYIENLKNMSVDPSNPQKIIFEMKRVYIQNVLFTTDVAIIQRKFYDPENILAKYTFAQLDDSAFAKNPPADLVAWSNNFNDVSKYGNDPAYIKGAGPYQVVEWNRGQNLILEKKKNHWTDKLANPNPYQQALPDKIIFKINGDENSTKLEYASQILDVSAWTSAAAVMDLIKDSTFTRNYNYKFLESYNYNYAAMNLKPDGIQHKKIFTDAKVRRAMAYLTPVDQIIQVVAYGKGTRLAAGVSPIKPEYNSELPLIPYDVEAAKKLLDEAGWIDTDGDNIRDKVVDGEKIPLSFNLGYMTTQKFVADMAQLISDAMYKAGVKANLKPYESVLLYEETKNHNFDMTLGAWASSSYPQDYSQLWHSSEYANFGANFTGFGNAVSDALIDSIKVTLDDSKRHAMEKRLQKIIYDEQPYIFLYQPMKRVIIHKRFGNQVYVFERPNVLLNFYKLLSKYGIATGNTLEQSPMM